MPTEPLTESALNRALGILGDRDPDLGAVLSAYGRPPLWMREPGFPSLVHIILEQQVSRASARAAFDRLKSVLPDLTPASFLTLGAETLRDIGFSRQKTRYCRGLATAIIRGTFPLEELAEMDDDLARSELLRIVGIGAWTADVYLLMALRRPDIWPSGDIALIAAAHEVKALPTPPSADEFEALGEQWRPWRAVAARVLWHHYISSRTQTAKREARRARGMLDCA